MLTHLDTVNFVFLSKIPFFRLYMRALTCIVSDRFKLPVSHRSQSLATASPLVSLSRPHLVEWFCHTHKILQKQDPEGLAGVHELGLYLFIIVLGEIYSQEPSGKTPDTVPLGV